MQFTARQLDAWDALHDPSVSEVMYGGAKGGGKSVFLCLWAFLHAGELAAEYRLCPSDKPPVVGWIGRKRAVDFRDTTLRTWRRFIPADQYVIRESDRLIVIQDAVAISFGGLDDQTDIQKFNSAEYAFIGIDQAEETTRDDVSALRASLRLVIDPAKGIVPRKALYTANPAECWLKDEFLRKPSPSQRFVTALPRDNIFLGSEYVETLRQSFGHRPELLRAYIDGSWDDLSGSDQIIQSVAVTAAAQRVSADGYRERRVVSVDVARFGDDSTVIYSLRGSVPVRLEEFGHRPTDYTIQRTYLEAKRHGAEIVVVDATGVGAGVADGLVAMGLDVLAVETGAAATEPDRYVNLRAQVWDRAARAFQAGEVSWGQSLPDLAAELCWPKYEYRGNRLLVESKTDIKARHGKSPDHADAYVLGLAALDFLCRKAYQEHENPLRLTPGRKFAEPSGPPAETSYIYRRKAREAELTRGRW